MEPALLSSKHSHRLVVLAIGVGLALAACREEPQGPPPSFLLFVVDDLGWMDSAVYGSAPFLI